MAHPGHQILQGPPLAAAKWFLSAAESRGCPLGSLSPGDIHAVGGQLGCHIVGDAAAEITQVVAIAIKMKATKADFDATVALHPTAAEELVTMRTPTARHVREAAAE